MLAKNYLSLFYFISLFHHSWHSNTVLTKVRDRNGEKSVNAVGDFMTTKKHRNLEELELDVKLNKKLTKAEKYQRLHLLPLGYSIVTDEEYEFFTPKIQLVPTVDGRKQFAISFVGKSSMNYRFSSMADKRINSIKELGHKLDEAYREDHKLQAEIFNDPTKIKSHEYLVTDGKDVFSINVGRNRETWGNILKTRYGLRMDGGESLPKPPKIKKKRGNLFVQGWLTEEMEKELKPTFGGESERRGIFGRRKSKRVEIEMKDAKQKLAEAFKKQSERYGWPNPVSASFTGYNVRKGPGTPKRIEHLDEAEISRVNILPERSEQEVVDLFYKKGWIDDEKEWQNPELKRLAQNAKQRYGVIPFIDEKVSSLSGSLSSGSGRIRTEIGQPGPSSTMHSASGDTSMSGRGRHQSVPSTPSNGHEQSMEMRRIKNEKRKGLFGRRKGIFGRNGGFARRFG